MKLWIDGQCFQSASRERGIGRYAIQLVRALAENRPSDEIHISLNSNTMERALLAHDLINELVPSATTHTWHGVEDGGDGEVGQTTHRQVSHEALLHHVVSIQPDVALSISPFEGISEPYTPFLPPAGFEVPAAAVFYDAIPKRLSSFYLNNQGAKLAYDRRFGALGNFDRLLAISEYSASEANELLERDDVQNIGAGLHPEFFKALESPISDRVIDAISDLHKTILYVGGLDYRKNLPATIKALSNLPASLRNKVEFVIVGAKHETELNLLVLEWARAGMGHDQLKLFGFASDLELAGLYRTADIVIQPSLLEGFGLTALEALVAGTPVLASNTGALPEVVSEPNFLFDPSDTDSMTRTIQWALENEAELASATLKAKEAAQKFTWEKVARSSADALEQLVQSRPRAGDIANDAKLSALGRLSKIKYKPGSVATILSSAEVRPETSQRFLIDITSTARIDHKSGIQRVVKNMCKYLPEIGRERGSPPIELIGTDTDLGFFPTRLDGGSGAWDDRRDETLMFHPSDTLLMLDSSWEFYAQHEDTLRNARINGTKVVSVLYDLVPAMTPAFCDPGMPTVFVPWLKSCLSYSDGIVCISKAVADELIRLLEAVGFPRSINVGWWHLGADFAAVPDREDDSSQSNSKFLSVGTIEPRKGHDVLLAAFDKLWSEGEDVWLTIVGRMGWGMDEFVKELQVHPEYGRKLIWHSQMSDEQLMQIYSEHSALIAASYGEGFGLPIIEAAHHDIPTIASDLKVFREISNNSPNVTYFETGNSSDLAEKVLAHASSSRTYDTSQSIPALSWSESAAALHDVVWGDQWYHRYEPHTELTGGITNLFPKSSVSAPLTADERSAYDISLLGKPIVDVAGQKVKFAVRVKNRSVVTWSSQGSETDKMGVVLAAMPINSGGVLMGTEAYRSKIPFAVPPEGELIQSISIPMSDVLDGATSVIIDLLQNGCGVFGDPIEVSLADSMDNLFVSDYHAFEKVTRSLRSI